MANTTLIRGEASDGTPGNVAQVDEIHPALVTIDVVHWLTHQGRVFTASFFQTPAAAAIVLLVRTHATRVAHMAARASADAATRIEFFEGPTSSAPGAAVAAINRNRLSGAAADTLIFSGPTVSVDGEKLGDGFIPGGSGGNAPGGQGSTFGEYNLALATDYLVRLSAITGTIEGSVILDWYENP